MMVNLKVVIEQSVLENRSEDLVSHLFELHDHLELILDFNRKNKLSPSPVRAPTLHYDTQSALRTSELLEDASPERNEKEEEVVASRMVECPVCMDEFTDPTLLIVLSGCGHTYCKGCLRAYLQERVDSGRLLQIDCPAPKCGEEVSLTQVRATSLKHHTSFLSIFFTSRSRTT